MTGRVRKRTETSAGGVVVRMIDGVRHALVIRDPYKKWGLPKGHTEEDESRQETALREVREETGLSDLRIGPELVTIDWSFHAEGEQIHKYTTFYLMYSDRGDPVPERREGITRAEWVPLDRAHDRISYENASEVVKVAQRVLRDADRGVGRPGQDGRGLDGAPERDDAVDHVPAGREREVGEAAD